MHCVLPFVSLLRCRVVSRRALERVAFDCAARSPVRRGVETPPTAMLAAATPSRHEPRRGPPREARLRGLAFRFTIVHSAFWADVFLSLGQWGAEPPRGGGRAGVLKNRKQKTEGGQGPHYD